MMRAEAEMSRLRRVLAPAADELAAVERLLHGLVAGPGDHDWLGTTVSALLDAGGKRLRPALVLLCAHAGACDPETAVPAAAAVELLHLASLVHDDVIDQGVVRRGFPTINARWGDALAILTGDYLFGKALAVMAQLPSPAVRELADVIGRMVAGEVDQELGRGRVPGIDEYLARIGRKTAELMAACCRIGAVVGGATEELTRALGAYGWWLGLTYQLVDDLLDVRGDPRALGKAVGMDASRGVATLPAILASPGGPGPDGSREEALEAAETVAADFSARARAELAELRPGWLRCTLEDLATLVADRRS